MKNHFPDVGKIITEKRNLFMANSPQLKIIHGKK